MRPQIDKPEKQNRILDPMSLAKPGKTRGLTGTGPGLERQETAGRCFGQFWNQTEPFFQSKPGPLAGYPHPLLTLYIASCCHFQMIESVHLGSAFTGAIIWTQLRSFSLYIHLYMW